MDNEFNGFLTKHGVTIQRAAELSGIPIEDCHRYAEGAKMRPLHSFALGVTAYRPAIKAASSVTGDAGPLTSPTTS